MKRQLVLLSLFIWGVSASSVMAQPAFTIDVFPSLAPNVFGSPSYPGWETNAITALQNSSTTQGNSALPTYYQQIPGGSTIFPWLVTDFNSWKNKANPGTVFGPAFASEFGNRLYFNLHITTAPEQRFSISQLSFTAASSDPGNFLGYTISAGTFQYGSGYVGLDYGPNGVKGGGDDVIVTSGPNTTLVNELFARGSGNAPVVLGTDPGATEQDKINNALANLPGQFIFSGSYSLNVDGPTVNGSNFVVVGVPEPSTIIIACAAGLGAGAVIFRKRRRKMRSMKVRSVS